MPAITTEFRECPDGNDAEVSGGGMESSSGGRARSLSRLPTTVMASDPPTAITISTSGVRRRQTRHITTTMVPVMMVIQKVPPEWLKAAIAAFNWSVRRAIIASSTGWSNRATPVPASTAS